MTVFLSCVQPAGDDNDADEMRIIATLQSTKSQGSER